MSGTTIRFESDRGPIVEMVVVGGKVFTARVLREGAPTGDMMDVVRVLKGDGLTLAQACERAVEEASKR